MERDPQGQRLVDEEPKKQPPVGKDPLRGSLASRTWLALAAFGAVFLLLVIFLAQNTERVPLNFLGWDWNPPLAVALLAASAAGLLLALTAGSLRIWQLRRRVHRT